MPQRFGFFRKFFKGMGNGAGSNICDVEATDFFDDSCLLYPTKINMFAKERDHFFRGNLIFQAFIFRGHLNFSRGVYT